MDDTNTTENKEEKQKNNNRSESIQTPLEGYDEIDGSTFSDLESIGRAIVDGDGVLPSKALEVLQSIADGDEQNANEILAVFPPTTEIKSVYTRRWAFDLLESLIMEDPQAGLQHSEQLVELLSANNKERRERALDLLLILAEEDASQLVLTKQSFDRLMESDLETRINVYRLLELAGTDSELPLLKEWLEYESGEPAEACRTAIQSIKQRD